MVGYVHRPVVDSNVRPVHQPLRRLPLQLRQPVSDEIQRMLREDVIEPVASSPWISNIVPVKKPDGTIRVCIDLTEPNRSVIPGRFPLPTFEELSSQLSGAQFFTKIDLKRGYLQLPLAPEARNLTAFVCHEGVFRFKRVPFGLCSAVAAFQKFVALQVKGI